MQKYSLALRVWPLLLESLEKMLTSDKFIRDASVEGVEHKAA